MGERGIYIMKKYNCHDVCPSLFFLFFPMERGRECFGVLSGNYSSNLSSQGSRSGEAYALSAAARSNATHE